MSSLEKPTVAFVLSLIAGVLILVGGGARAVLGLVIRSFGSRITGGHRIMGAMMGMMGSGLGLIGIVGIVFGLIVIVSAIMLNIRPEQHMTWGALIAVFSILSLFGGAGGFFVGLILGLIGGILAITWKPAKS
jgi:hypothetical protein